MPADKPVVDIWYARVPADTDSEELAQLGQLLTPVERAQEAQYRLPELRAQFRVTRVLARSMLAKMAQCDARELHFEVGSHGKPHVCRPSINGTFNISHTRGAVLCATTARGHVGVDIERLDRSVNLELADRYFAELEIRQLTALEISQRAQRFMQLWTLKEAFIKALGTGLATPLDQFAFEFGEREPLRLHVYDQSLGPVSRWQFHQFEIEKDFLAAVGVVSDVAGESPAPCDVRLHKWPGPDASEL